MSGGMGANLCSTLGRRADDLCPGLGGLPPVLRVGAEGVAFSANGGLGYHHRENLDILHKKLCIFMHI